MQKERYWPPTQLPPVANLAFNNRKKKEMSFLKNFDEADPKGKLLLVKVDQENLTVGEMVLCIEALKAPSYVPGKSTLTLSILAGGKRVNFSPRWPDNLSKEFSIVEMGQIRPLQGKKIAITGALKYNRPFYKTLIEIAGGKYSSTVTLDTTHLVTDDTALTTKVKAAKERNVQIINSEQLSKMINVAP